MTNVINSIKEKFQGEKPVMETVEVPEQPESAQTPNAPDVEPTEEEPVTQEPEPSVPPVAEQTELNCPSCNGEGLESPTKRCERCGGTGKV